jgi:hypothetical protein
MVTVIEWTEAELARLAGQNVIKGPDGGLRDGRDEPVSDGLACMLLAHESGTHPVDPGDYQRGYLRAGHAADSPMNTRVQAVTIDPATGGRSTTPPDDGDGVEKVVAASDFHRDYLTLGHASPSPADRPGNSPAAPVTGSGQERYRQGAEAYEGNQQRARAEHVMPSQCVTAQPATSRWSPPPGLGAANVPQPRAAGATRKAPGE